MHRQVSIVLCTMIVGHYVLCIDKLVWSCILIVGPYVLFIDKFV